MPFDPTIALQAAPQGPPDWSQLPNQIAKMQEYQFRLQQEQQEIAGQNAIKSLYTNPQSFGPNGMPTPQTVNRLMSIDPPGAMNYVSQLYQQQQAQQRLQQQGQQNYDKIQKDWVDDVVSPAVAEYESTLQKTGSQQQAQDAAQQTLTQGREEFLKRGLGPSDALDRLTPRQFDYPRMSARATGLKGYRDYQKQQAQEQRAQREEGRKDVEEKRKDIELGLKQQEATQKEFGPATNVMATGPDGKQFQTVGVQDLAGGGWRTTDRSKPLNVTQVLGRSAREGDVIAGFGPTTGDITKTGQAYLNSLPPQQATEVKALSEGRIPFPTGFSLARLQPLIQAVSQYDPNFDAVNYNARYKTRSDFTSGQSARNITSINTVMGHLETLKKAAEALNNGQYPLFNSLINRIKTGTGRAQVTNFDTARDVVADELERTFRGTSGSVTGIKSWREGLTSSASPEQQHGAWQTLGEILDSRVDALGDTYSRGMGRTVDGMTLLSPRAQGAYTYVTGRTPDIKTVGPTGTETITPGQAQGQGQGLPPPNGHQDIIQGGNHFTWRNGKYEFVGPAQ